MARRTFETLNAMRGIAAIGVVLFHGQALWRGAVAPHGYLAVDIFFMLSGFVIAHAYEERFRRGLKVAEFAKIRIIRFYPLYGLGLALGLVRYLMLKIGHNADALPSTELVLATLTGLVFLPFPLPSHTYDLFLLNPPSWSLFYELVINVCYASVALRLGKVTLAAVVVISGICLVPLVLAAGSADLGANAFDIGAGVARTVFSFGLGVLIYRTRPEVPNISPLLVLAGVALVVGLPLSSPYYDLACIVLVSPLLLIFGAGSEPPPLLHRPFVFLGLISFPLYAVHRPILAIGPNVAHMLHLSQPLAGGVIVVGLLVVCPLLDRYYDAPLRRWLSLRFKERVLRDPAEAAAP
jgi:peptidoglycan/LPS O-acetylase OafA/YrhL